MKINQSSTALLEATVKKAINRYTHSSGQPIVTDIHLQPNPVTGELIIFDDDDTVLASAVIEDWIAGEEDDFYGKAECRLTSLLNNMKAAGAFDPMVIMKPFSFVLVDAEKETVAELLLMDDDTLLVSDELLKGLDEELDAFLKELLEK